MGDLQRRRYSLLRERIRPVLCDRQSRISIEKIIEIIVVKEKVVEIPIETIIEKFILLQETIFIEVEPTIADTVEFVRNEIEVYYGEDNIPDEVFTNIPIEDVISEIEKTPIPPQPPPSGGGTTMADIKTEDPCCRGNPC